MKIRLAVTALLIALIFPLIAEAQSPQQSHHDGQQITCTIYSRMDECAPNLSSAGAKSFEVGTEIQFDFNRRATVRFGIREEKRFAPGTLVQPFPQRAIVMTVNWH